MKKMKVKMSEWKDNGKNPADTKPEYPEKFGKKAGIGRLRKGGVQPDYPEGHCLGPFKGTRAGAKRHGDTHIAGYPDSSHEGSGHPGAHE
jgi:hypothetical protein